MAVRILLLVPLVVALASAAHAQDRPRHELGPGEVVVPPPMDVPYRQIVDPARHVEGSVSVGTTSDGRLSNAAVLPDESPGHYVLALHRERDTHHGSDEMIRLILDASAHVRASHGTRVGVGNISGPAGGRISWSRSHNNGRDADLAFQFLTPEGEPAEVETLVRVNRNGIARDGSERRFDVERSWTLIEALLTHPDVQVQWIFVYDPLKQMLLEHARSIGVDGQLVSLAEDILHQPGDSAPHDDHFHVRIYCSRSDRLEGCANWGPEWAHAQLWNDAVQARVDELMRGVADADADVGIECLERANVLAGSRLAQDAANALPHAPTRTRLALMELLAEYDQPGVSGAIVPLLESDPNEQVRAQAAWLLGYLADPTSAAPLAALVARGGRPLDDGTPLDVAAAHALRNVWAPGSVAELVPLAATADDRLRAELGRVLSRATGVTPPVDPAEARTAEARKLLHFFWAEWAAEHATEPQSTWYLDAFHIDGATDATTWDEVPLQVFVTALRDDREHIRFIADRALVARTTGWTPSEGWTVERRYGYWSWRTGLR